jgi:hypothetical protein
MWLILFFAETIVNCGMKNLVCEMQISGDTGWRAAIGGVFVKMAATRAAPTKACV